MQPGLGSGGDEAGEINLVAEIHSMKMRATWARERRGLKHGRPNFGAEVHCI